MFGDEAERLLRTIRARHSRDEPLFTQGVEHTRGERIRELVRIVQESGVAEIEIEDEGMRVSVRRTDEALQPVGTPLDADEPALAAPASFLPGIVHIESPMVGTFYRAPQSGTPPFVEVGDTIVPGQTLCILEAMKLMNEVKAELAGVVRTIHVENAQPVEFGQLLFDVEPIAAPPAV